MINGGNHPQSRAAWELANSEIGAVYVPFLDHLPAVEVAPELGPVILAAGDKDNLPTCNCTDPECHVKRVEYKLMPLVDETDMLRGLSRFGVSPAVLILRK